MWKLPESSMMGMNLHVQFCGERDEVDEYIMQVDDEFIETSVTHCKRKVEEWIGATEQRNHLRLHRLIVVLNIQWSPSTLAGKENPVAILQLLVNTRCLIYRIQKTESFPDGLKNFLKNPNYTFVGVGIENYKQKLYKDCSLEVTNTMDLREMAAHELAEPDLSIAILQQLVRRFLHKYVDAGKSMNVRMSDWDSNKLSDEQVLYASLDAYVSFAIARILQSWYD